MLAADKEDRKILAKEWKENEWLTPSLLEELKLHYLKGDDIDRATGARDKERLACHFKQVFPPGRKWASPRQLILAVEHLGSRWG